MIKIRSLSKAYDQPVLKAIDLDVEEGEFVVLLGPSGCGKTTLLKSLNKMIEYDSGSIEIDGKDIEEWDKVDLRRSIGYVIQQIGLFPHLTVADNISYVLDLIKVPKKERYDRAEKLIEMVGLDKSMLSRYPRELSGGQRQRVGVARALAADAKIILMDEPFGAVDELARTRLQDELKGLQDTLNKTIIFVTHDIDEALKLGTKIVLMNDGNIEQIGTPEELVYKPWSRFVEDFLGLKGFKSLMKDELVSDLYREQIITFGGKRV